jgi:phosphate/phosphite/phosphonate ABC transporter binding protein
VKRCDLIGRRELVVGALGLAACRGSVDANKERHDPLDQLDAAGEAPSALRIGITPTVGGSTSERLAPLLSYLEKRLGIGGTGITAPSYATLAEMVGRREVELAVFSPNAYVNAHDAGVEAVAIATATQRGSPTYLGYLLMRDTRSSATSRRRPLALEAARGKRVAWVDRASASGYLYPRAMLMDKGHDPDGFFGEQLELGDHARVVEALLTGEVDVGAVASTFADPGTGSYVQGADELSVVAKTKHIPFDCVVVHRRLRRAIARDLRTALLELTHDEPARRALGASWGLDGFVQPMHDRYAEIRRIRAQVTRG